jgi:IclR family transcriptional regulator, KDG regulon repressor
VPGVPAVKRALRVLELLANESEPLTLQQIVAETGIPLASAHAIMHTLLDAGYASKQTVGRAQVWSPTLALYHLGSSVVSRLGLRDVALPHLRALSASLGVPAHLGVLVGADVMYLEKVAAPSFIQFSTYPGLRSPFHLTALGRAIAAFLSPAELSPLLAGIDPRFSRILRDVKAAGFATEDGDEVEGVGCVAAPVRDASGRVVASVGITGFSAELFINGEIPSVVEVMAAAETISRELGHRGEVAPVPASAAS